MKYPCGTLCIGGLRFRLSCGEPVALDPPDAPYERFREPAPGQQDCIDVDVGLEYRPIALPPEDLRVFDTGEAWAMYRAGADRILVQTPRDGSGARWSAAWTPGTRRVRLACVPELRREEGGAVRAWNPLTYPLDIILVMHLLGGRDGAVVHGAGVAVGDDAFLFAGRSGAGKSTISRQFDSLPDTLVLSDDRIVLRPEGNGWRAFGTPWLGDARRASPESRPLRGLFFLAHAPENSARRLSVNETAERLLPVLSVPWFDAESVPALLDFCGALASSVPAWELSFRPEPAAALYAMGMADAGLKPAISASSEIPRPGSPCREV